MLTEREKIKETAKAIVAAHEAAHAFCQRIPAHHPDDAAGHTRTAHHDQHHPSAKCVKYHKTLPRLANENPRYVAHGAEGSDPQAEVDSWGSPSVKPEFLQQVPIKVENTVKPGQLATNLFSFSPESPF